MSFPKSPTSTIVMTGATRGLGRVAAIKLLRSATPVHLVVLARGDADAAAAQLRDASGNPNVSGRAADLASLSSLRDAAARIREDLDSGSLPPLHGLVGNAGVQLMSPSTATEDGVEATFAVNVLAHYVLIEALRDRLVAPARVVLTASDTHFGDFKHNMGMVPGPSWRAPDALAVPAAQVDAADVTAGRTAYATSKLAVIYLAHALARRLPDGVEVFSFNPGLVPGTGLQRDAGALDRFAFRWLLPIMTATPFARSARRSGRDLAEAVVGAAPGPSGCYVNGSAAERSSDESYAPDREEALWAELALLAARGALVAT